MAMASGRTRCITCGKEKATFRCGGCLRDFCSDHVADHRQELNKQLDEVEVNRDLFRETLTEKIANPQRHPLMEQINKWESDSINKIRQTAEETRQILLEHTTGYTKQVEVILNKLTEELRRARREEDFFETDLRQWSDRLTQLKNELNEPSHIMFRQGSETLITKIHIDIETAPLYFSNINTDERWSQNGIIVAGGNGKGNDLNQLRNPYGIYVDDDQTVYIADYGNNRIVAWENGARCGRVVAGGNKGGDKSDQLNSPTDVILDTDRFNLIICDHGNRRVVLWPLQNGTRGATIISNINGWGLVMDSDEYLYVSDQTRHDVRRWRIGDTTGFVVAGGNRQGNRLHQLNTPRNICIDQDQSLYVSDNDNNRVIKWLKGAKEGIVIDGEQDQRNSRARLSSPNGVIINHSGTVFIADSKNNRVMSWCPSTLQSSIVIEKKLDYPTGLSFDRYGNLYVVDHVNNRVQKFNTDYSLNG